CSAWAGAPAAASSSGPVRSGVWANSGAPEVVARAGVDLDLDTLLEEERDLDLQAGLHGGGLGAGVGAVALQARLGLRDGEGHRGGELDEQHPAVVHGDDDL